jgi:hypothetical protein
VVSGGSAVANFRTESQVGCTNGAEGVVTLSFGGPASLQSDLSFTYTYDGPLQSSDPSLTNITIKYSISGTFDTAGNVSGSLVVNNLSFDQDGDHYDCSNAPFHWSAKHQ